MKTVMIVGCGYAGAGVAARLAALNSRRAFQTIIIDPSEWHVVKTRLHQAAVSPERDILVRLPIKTLAGLARAEFIQAEANSIDLNNRKVIANGSAYEWDYLVVAAGAEANYFGVPGASERAAGILNFDAASDCGKRVKSLSIGKHGASMKRVVVCGAGLLGVEFASQLRQYYSANKCDIVIVEKLDRIIAASQCGDSARNYIESFFSREKIKVLTGKAITEISDGLVKFDNGQEIDCDLAVWCSGVKRKDVGGVASGRFVVDASLRGSSEHEGVYSAGDFATVDSARANANSLTAQRAIYHSDIVAKNIARAASGLRPRVARYRPKGELISLGDFDGVGVAMGIPLTGAACASAKKANELKYLVELFGSAIHGYLV